MRADIRDELAPNLARPYRCVHAKPLQDVLPHDATQLEAAITSLRALCARIVSEMASGDQEIIRRLNDISEPGALADMVAAAAIQDASDRRKILVELDVTKRLELASAALGALVLRAHGSESVTPPVGWGMSPGKA
jgi:hypothetical protein